MQQHLDADLEDPRDQFIGEYVSFLLANESIETLDSGSMHSVTLLKES